MIELFNIQGHLTSQAILLLKQDKLQMPDKIKALSHIGQCEECALSLSECYGQEELIALPADFKNETLNKIKAAAPKALPSPKRQQWGYALRGGLAICAALILVFSGCFNHVPNLKSPKIPVADLSFVNAVTHQIRSFSDKIIQLEDFNDVKKTK